MLDSPSAALKQNKMEYNYANTDAWSLSIMYTIRLCSAVRQNLDIIPLIYLKPYHNLCNKINIPPKTTERAMLTGKYNHTFLQGFFL